MIYTLGMSPIRIEFDGQFPCWYWYSGGSEKGLQISTIFGYDAVARRRDIFAFTYKFTNTKNIRHCIKKKIEKIYKECMVLDCVNEFTSLTRL